MAGTAWPVRDDAGQAIFTQKGKKIMFEFNGGGGGWIPTSVDTPWGSVTWGNGGYYPGGGYPQQQPPVAGGGLFGGGNLMPLLLVGFLAYLIARK